MMRELATGLVEAGCTVDVVTTSLRSAGARGRGGHAIEEHDGATVVYAATPVSYRWIGITPTAAAAARTAAAAGRRARLRFPGPRRHDGRNVVPRTTACRTSSRPSGCSPEAPQGRSQADSRRDRLPPRARGSRSADRLLARRGETSTSPAGSHAARIVGAPERLPAGPPTARAALRSGCGSPPTPRSSSPSAASPKGRASTCSSARSPGSRRPPRHRRPGRRPRHVGSGCGAWRASSTSRTGCTFSVRFATSGVLDALRDADVVALASAHESFGMVAAEAAAAGRPILLTDRCGVAELLGPDAAPRHTLRARRGLRRARPPAGDPALRARLGDGARAVAREWSWSRVVRLQRGMYEEVAGAGGRAA